MKVYLLSENQIESIRDIKLGRNVIVTPCDYGEGPCLEESVVSMFPEIASLLSATIPIEIVTDDEKIAVFDNMSVNDQLNSKAIIDAFAKSSTSDKAKIIAAVDDIKKVG